jgi:hypothetical protein
VDLTQLEPDVVAQRQHGAKKGIVPPNCLGVVIGGDTGKRALHWSAHAILADGCDVVIDYGEQPVAWEQMGVTESLIAAFQELGKYWSAGWMDETGKRWSPVIVWCDSGYSEHQAAVYSFCRAAGLGVYYPVKGFGQNVYGRNEGYHPPKSLSETVRYIGRGMHSSWQPVHGVHLINLDSDSWRSEFQARLKLDPMAPGAIRLYTVADPAEHADWCNHVTADRLMDVFDAGRRVGVKWTQIRKANHWGDAGYYGTAAGQFLRDMLQVQSQKKTTAKQPQQQTPRNSDREAWIPTR